MASSKDNFNSPTDSRHLTQIIDNLTIDDQRKVQALRHEGTKKGK